ncbi:Hypothetical protein PHPALM_8495 [Phytophthora palmivora]|uniref:Uncharacterized protein n=1 Tax=Phytophthora palmivora TaxID=4796 RepID=A0A2P4Y9N4_9STRA|nr:Hypothetical protein PHPALM_8495 [Phytophthora palmivora]
MPGYTIDSDSDVEMSLPQPIFEVIRAPELSSWDHVALIEWLREWECYVEKMRHRCTTTGETYENVVVTVKGCVKRKTLKNMATYEIKKPVADVTDADIMGAVQARCRTLKNEFVSDVTSLFRQKLKMDLLIDDCDARVFRYYEDFNGIMEDNGLQGLIGADNTTDAGFKSRMKAYSSKGFVPSDVAGLCRKGGLKAAKPDLKPQKTSHAGTSAKAGSARSTPSPAQPSASAREPQASATGGVPGVQGCTLAQSLPNGNRRPAGGRPGEVSG